MKWIVGVLLVVSPVLADAQVNNKDGSVPAGTCDKPQQEIYQAKRAVGSMIFDTVITSGIPDVPRIPMQQDSRRHPTSYKMDRKELNRLPYTNVNDGISTFPGVYQQQRGSGISVYGSR